MVEEAKDLPRLELTGADPYCTAWYQREPGTVQPADGQAAAAGGGCCGGGQPPVPEDQTGTSIFDLLHLHSLRQTRRVQGSGRRRTARVMPPPRLTAAWRGCRDDMQAEWTGLRRLF